VDDDYVSNFIAEKIIRSHGGVRMVTAVSDGKQALEYLKHQCDEEDPYACPDLILLDLNMPYFDGYDFVLNFRKKPEFKNISVVVVTSTEPQEEKKKLLEEAGISYMIKPLTAEKFNKILDEQLHHS
jgi:CheY-like chemotaxis protein